MPIPIATTAINVRVAGVGLFNSRRHFWQQSTTFQILVFLHNSVCRSPGRAFAYNGEFSASPARGFALAVSTCVDQETCGICEQIRTLKRSLIGRDDDPGIRGHRFDQAKFDERAGFWEETSSFAKHKRMDLQNVFINEITPH